MPEAEKLGGAGYFVLSWEQQGEGLVASGTDTVCLIAGKWGPLIGLRGLHVTCRVCCACLCGEC